MSNIQNKFFFASLASGAIKGIVFAISLTFLGVGKNIGIGGVFLGSIGLSAILDLIMFYSPNMRKHKSHLMSDDDNYIFAVEQAILQKGSIRMIMTNWFMRDIDEILSKAQPSDDTPPKV